MTTQYPTEIDITSEEIRTYTEAAVNLQKQLARLFRYAVWLNLIESNPVELAESVKPLKTGGRHTWTEEEIAQYRKHHAIGTNVVGLASLGRRRKAPRSSSHE